MTRNPRKLIPATFPPVPGLDALEALQVTIGAPGPAAAAVGYVVFAEGDVPAALGFTRESLDRAGFEAEVGKTLVIPMAKGPELIAVGAGEAAELDTARLRDLAAAFARATDRHDDIALVVPELAVGSAEAARTVVEGIALARYRYTPLQADPKSSPLTSLTVDVEATDADAQAGLVTARSAVVARDLMNTPPGHLTATDLGNVAVSLGARFGFEVELFDKAALIELGCGGILGVNRGSTEEPRLIKLTYRPEGAATGRLGLVGKGITYDSGGISLKPSDPMHLLMKMDMGGAAAVLGAFAALRESGVSAEVIGWLACTDNMISGDSYRLGDVLVARDGTTVEVKNTDAEGRIVMMDAISLAVEDNVDAIIDIATLTGAALMALGQSRAPVFGTDQSLVDLTLAAAAATDEPLWQFPLEQKYRPQINSKIADLSNIGTTRYAGSTTAALFLAHFAKDLPWAHLDIAGTMQLDEDDSWRSAGATGFGARILVESARNFTD